MPKAKLRDYAEEDVTLLTRTVSTAVTDANPYGEQVEGYAEGETLTANVQPLGNDLREVYELAGSVEALRVQLPTVLIVPLDRLRARGRDWVVVHSETWQDYTLIIVQGAQ